MIRGCGICMPGGRKGRFENSELVVDFWVGRSVGRYVANTDTDEKMGELHDNANGKCTTSPHKECENLRISFWRNSIAETHIKN